MSEPPQSPAERESSIATCRLLLILSPERSGSTLLSVMLGAHSRVLAPPELHLLRFPSFETWKASYPIAMRSLVALWQMMGLSGSEREIEAAFRNRSSLETYRWLLTRCSSDDILVDKTPAYGRSLGFLERAERLRPEYLWLVRHPLGVAASRMERRHQKRRRDPTLKGRLKYPWYLLRRAVQGRSGRVSREVEYWVEVHDRIGRFLTHVESSRWRRIYFESLVQRPQRELEGVVDWLGIPYEPSMLRPSEHAPLGLQWGLGDGKLLHHTSIDPTVAHRWRQTLDENILSAEASALMERLGMDPSSS